MTSERARVAGWYDDEVDAALLRYWDGVKWSPHTAPRPTDAEDAEDAVDEVDESTRVRTSEEDNTVQVQEEHTTVPLPPEDAGHAASAGFSNERKRLVWIIGGAVVALALVSGAVVLVWSAVSNLAALMLR
ncbi:DUF2510 domain-containing protein [Agromyces sp. Soil535]|uniref:DUF2510 domain-containing protein n=1 Tax=Agromyces sp. Soil535 TaxID=1736390 RepID=UPI0006FCD072|nr:DUF2510 domain-containing protein [Agromyces sp. Soil535]KRE21806.1 hypothetical protein ASG80_11985 [Agromyces sp. Soil535]